MEQHYVMIYNFMFTAAPPLAMGAYEKRLHENLLSKSPKLYRYVSFCRISSRNLLIILSTVSTGPSWKRLSQSILAGDAGFALAEPRYIFCRRFSVQWAWHWHLAIWSYDRVVLSCYHAVSFCIGGPNLGKYQWVINHVLWHLTIRFFFISTDNNSHRCHLNKLGIFLHFCLCLQHNVHIMLGTSKHSQDNSRLNVESSVLSDHFPNAGYGFAAAILHKSHEKYPATGWWY